MPSKRKSAVLRLKNMTFFGYHGVTDAEKETGCRFEVDCEFHYDITDAVKSDSLEDTVDYSSVYDTINDLIQKNKFNLVETLAQRLADALLDEFAIKWLKVLVRKINPPISGNIDSFEVEVERQV
ncbi:MAG: dihydroneopterin aldolase [candidate division Zixibacteria bacterium]|nr:dihydroneopterin aldolase [candidate division Zixibacteria bacterium]